MRIAPVALARFSRACLFLAAAFPLTAVAAQNPPLATPPGAPPQPQPLVTGEDPAPADVRESYRPQDLARYAPRNALDMLRNIPGFTIRADHGGGRGLGQASDNVLQNGQRFAGKSGDLTDELSRIPVSSVVRIDIVDGAELAIPGLSGQVANIITRPDVFSGQFRWSPEYQLRHAHPGYTDGEISVRGALTPRLEYTLALANEADRRGYGGGYRVNDGAGDLIERRDGRFWADYDSPSLSGSLRWDPSTDRQANAKTVVRNRYSTFVETEGRRPIAAAGNRRDLYGQNRETGYELSADYAFPLAGGRLKLIGIDNFRRRETTDRLVTTVEAGSGSAERQGGRFDQASRAGEIIGRAEYGWKWGQADWQLAVEAAFNRLDLDSTLFDLDPDGGDFVERPFPGGDGGVREARYEGIASYGRPLSSRLTMQLSAGVEQSTISQTGPGGLSRSFIRPKGSALFAWAPRTGTDLSLRVEREVGQLEFFDFLASVSLDQGNQNASNAELVPQQGWNIEIEGRQDLGPWGSTELRVFYRRIEDFVTLVLLDEGGEGTGNVPLASRYGLEWTSTIKFDPLGFRGGKLDSRLIWQRSRFDDPLTGLGRAFDNFTERLAVLDLRHDIPGSDWAWGAGARYERLAPYYRLGEIGREADGPWFSSLFVENKDVRGLTIRTEVRNLLGARNRRYRTVFDGDRTGQRVLFSEVREQGIGPRFQLSVKGSF